VLALGALAFFILAALAVVRESPVVLLGGCITVFGSLVLLVARAHIARVNLERAETDRIAAEAAARRAEIEERTALINERKALLELEAIRLSSRAND
jgi:hypothetical protein